MLLTFDFSSIKEAHEFLLRTMEAQAIIESRTRPSPQAAIAEPEVAIPAQAKTINTPAKSKTAGVKKYGLEDCRNALSELFDAKGRDVAKAALAEFKAAKVGDLIEAEYADFISLCVTRGTPE